MGTPNIILKTNTSNCIGLLSYLNKFFQYYYFSILNYETRPESKEAVAFFNST